MTIAEHRSTGDKDVATHLHSYTNLAALPHTPPLTRSIPAASCQDATWPKPAFFRHIIILTA